MRVSRRLGPLLWAMGWPRTQVCVMSPLVVCSYILSTAAFAVMSTSLWYWNLCGGLVTLVVGRWLTEGNGLLIWLSIGTSSSSCEHSNVCRCSWGFHSSQTWCLLLCQIIYSHVLHNDVSVNDGPHIRRWSHNIIIWYNTYHCITIAYSIQYSNMLYRFVA